MKLKNLFPFVFLVILSGCASDSPINFREKPQKIESRSEIIASPDSSAASMRDLFCQVALEIMPVSFETVAESIPAEFGRYISSLSEEELDSLILSVESRVVSLQEENQIDGSESLDILASLTSSEEVDQFLDFAESYFFVSDKREYVNSSVLNQDPFIIPVYRTYALYVESVLSPFYFALIGVDCTDGYMVSLMSYCEYVFLARLGIEGGEFAAEWAIATFLAAPTEGGALSLAVLSTVGDAMAAFFDYLRCKRGCW